MVGEPLIDFACAFSTAQKHQRMTLDIGCEDLMGRQDLGTVRCCKSISNRCARIASHAYSASLEPVAIPGLPSFSISNSSVSLAVSIKRSAAKPKSSTVWVWATFFSISHGSRFLQSGNEYSSMGRCRPARLSSSHCFQKSPS